MSHRQAKKERYEGRIARTRNLRDRPELLEHLREQRLFLHDSAVAYDRGTEREGKRLAVTLRTLLCDTKLQTSLLTQPSVLAELRFVDTADPVVAGNLVPTSGFVMMEAGPGGTRYLPTLGDLAPRRHSPPKPFEGWWNDVVTHLPDGSDHSRRDWVISVANREGGAHVDLLRDPLYEAVTRENALGWVTDQGIAPGGNVALASVRQIAYEVECTLDDQLPGLLPGS